MRGKSGKNINCHELPLIVDSEAKMRQVMGNTLTIVEPTVEAGANRGLIASLG